MSIRFALPLVLLPALACGTTAASVDTIAERYVRAALQLAQHDPELVEAWHGPEAWRPGPRVPVAELRQDVGALQQAIQRASLDVSSASERARIQYLEHQLRALRFAAERQLGQATSIDNQARREFGVTFARADRVAAANVLRRIGKLVPGGGTVAERVARLRQATIVPRERRDAVMAAALDACRTATMAVIDLPRDEGVRVLFRRGLPWDGYARYAGNHRSELEITDDSALDVSRALRLACHEGYPGHHVQHLLIERVFGERRWPELQLAPGFGPHLLLAEGAAEAGADLALSTESRRALYRDALYPAAGLDTGTVDTLVAVEDLLGALVPVVTDVARQYLNGILTQERAIERLRDEALVSNPAGTLAFIERRRARALVYGEGRRVVYGMMRSRDLRGLYDAFQTLAALQ